MASAAEVPHIYDCVISDGTTTRGFVFLDSSDKGTTNVPEKAVHSFSPTFVPRTNIQGNYGDDSQEFFLTFSQKDWSLGEQRKYQRRDNEPTRSYWLSENVDVFEPGEVTLHPAVASASFANAVRAVCPGLSFDDTNQTDIIYAASQANIYHIEANGTITDDGAHGLAVTPARFGLVSDGFDLYISSTTSGSAGVRKWTGSVFSTFSASAADSLCFVNNTLFGYRNDTMAFGRWDTSGTWTELFQWLQADGADRTPVAGVTVLPGVVRAFGGKVLIFLFGGSGGEGGAELWHYDGVGTSLLHKFPGNFLGYDLKILNGVVYLSGGLLSPAASGNNLEPVIFYYANGQVGTLWKAKNLFAQTDVDEFAGFPSLCVFDSTLVFNDDALGKLVTYNPALGGVAHLATYAVAGNNPLLTACQNFFLHTRNQTTAYKLSHTAKATTGTVTSSLIDFDSSLQKFFRGIEIDFDLATDGNFGSVDIAYRLNDLNSSYTTLQTGAVAGTEYKLGSVGSAIEGRSISVRITLNKGTSTLGPVLKRVYVRAAPIVNIFHRSRHWLDCQGVGEEGSWIELRNQSYEVRDGLELAHTLKEFSEAGLITFTDKFGSRTSVIEELEFTEVRPNEFIASILVREV